MGDHEVISILRSLLTENPPSPGKIGRTTLFSNSGVGSFMSHKNQISQSVVRWDQQFFFLV